MGIQGLLRYWWLGRKAEERRLEREREKETITHLEIVLPRHVSIVTALAGSISRRSNLLGGRCRIVVVIGAWSFPILHFDKAGLRKGKGVCLDGRHQYGSGGDTTAEQRRYRPTQRTFLPVVLTAMRPWEMGWSGVEGFGKKPEIERLTKVLGGSARRKIRNF
jgi:hypothetical protein